ncbi:MAG TPA: UDP-N-acetylmuramoyl-L-alanyl-D-glutamate--2,6-diaminopimelate ligase [Flavobacterium sp.]|nr:UDP-N-acetylmuramoyl-L-alanyl-D-glutamate--2,6-diaminopimelate ligase [Flavobacterium sp.]
MKNLKDIVGKTAVESIKGSIELSIDKIEFDSRKIAQADVFIAIKGTTTDGHQYIDKCIEQGAVAIVCEVLPQELKEGITYIKVSSSNKALAEMAANFYDNPSDKLKLVGVTGTNGKTTIATLLYSLFESAGYKSGLLSTVKIKVHQHEFAATHTTPDPLVINYYLNEMIAQGVEYCFMEVSSHGIHQSRTEGLTFAGGIFTNLSHDHLDYHSSFAEYRDVKKSFFDHLPKTAFAITNIDDKNGSVMLQNTLAKKRTYALKSYSDYKAHVLENQFLGLLLKIDNQEVYTKLIGNFNAYNLLAIYATAIELGLEKQEVLVQLSQLESVSGRFQYIISKTGITAIIDYSHTPDALENVLKTIADIRSGNEQLITVIGCGGDRDKTKRPIMAQIASEMSNKAIFTSDNPRTEDPQVILDEMEKGVEAQNYKKTTAILDRKQAIKMACQLAESGDIILIAGKGHETYQEINGIKHDFDDMKTVTELLEQLNK